MYIIPMLEKYPGKPINSRSTSVLVWKCFIVDLGFSARDWISSLQVRLTFGVTKALKYPCLRQTACSMMQPDVPWHQELIQLPLVVKLHQMGGGILMPSYICLPLPCAPHITSCHHLRSSQGAPQGAVWLCRRSHTTYALWHSHHDQSYG